MKSPTDAFEDAEIAREEASERDALIDVFASTRDGYGGLDDERIDAILAAGFTRQSPASTTAADAWDACIAAIDKACIGRHVGMVDNPYRVAAPEGDGGNE